MGHCSLLLAEAYGSSASALGVPPGGQKDREMKGSVGSSSTTLGSPCQGGMAVLQHGGHVPRGRPCRVVREGKPVRYGPDDLARRQNRRAFSPRTFWRASSDRGASRSFSSRTLPAAQGDGSASSLRRARHFSANRSSVSFKTSSVSSAYLLRSHRSSWMRAGDGLANNFFKIGKAASALPRVASNAAQNASSKRLMGPCPPSGQHRISISRYIAAAVTPAAASSCAS